MFSGIPSSIDANLRNADGTTGREGAGSVVSFSLANEDFSILNAISTQGSQFQFVSGRLKVDAALDASSITLGEIRLQDGVTSALATVKSVGGDFALVVVQDSQPLPVGASTEATLTTAQGNLASILATVATAANQGTEIGHLSTIDTNLAALSAKFSPLGQQASAASVSVAVASDQTVPISASSLPLPIGASTEATISAMNAKFTTTGSGLRVDGSAVVQPVSATSWPLPTGAATAANQGTEITSLASIDGKLTTTANGLKVDGSAVTQPVSAASLPLPAGASTAANQATANTSLASVDGKCPSQGQKLMAASLPVVIASDQSSVPITVASLPLPAGAATAANQVTANSSLSSIDGKLTGVALDSSLQSILTDLNKLTFTATRLLIDGSGVTQPVSAASLPLPAGASTAANQATANTSLSSIDGKMNSLGQKVMAASMPVTIASDQASIPVGASQVGTWTVALSAGSSVIGHVIVDSSALPTGASTEATLAAASAKLPATLGQHAMAASMSVAIASDQGAVPISAASLPLPAGAATSALQTTGNTSLSSIDGKLTTTANGLKVDGSAVTQPISAAILPLPTGAATETTLAAASAKLPATLGQKTMANSLAVVLASDQSTVAISAASLPLPTGAATSAKQPALGTAGTPSADVITVQGATSMTALKVDGSAVTQPISAAILPLPTGAATSANQTTAATSLSSIDGKLTHGQATMANSVPTVLSSDQSAIPVKTQDGSGNALTSTATSGKQAIDIAPYPDSTTTYMASTNGTVATGTGAANTVSIGYLWHPAANAKHFEIVGIVVSYANGSGNAGNFTVRGARITAENGTPGGTSQTINALDQADAASTGTFRTGANAPVRATGDYITRVVDASTIAAGIGGTASGSGGAFDFFNSHMFSKPIVLRASVAEGFEVRTIIGTALTTTIPVSVTFLWREV